jgi:hypothetical protein
MAQESLRWESAYKSCACQQRLESWKALSLAFTPSVLKKKESCFLFYELEYLVNHAYTSAIFIHLTLSSL